MDRKCLACDSSFELSRAVPNKLYCSSKCRLQARKQRNCSDCGEVIPLKIVVDGSKRVTNSRKKCLQCLPWRGPITLTETERSERNKAKCRRYYRTNSEVENQKSVARLTDLARSRKAKLVELIGGCQLCSYSKTPANLAFHHLHDKHFNISIGLSWNPQRIANELRKCVCICHNCHGEVHAGIVEVNMPQLNSKFTEAVDSWLATEMAP